MFAGGISLLFRESTARTSRLLTTVQSDAGVVVSASRSIVLPLVKALRRVVQVEATGG